MLIICSALGLPAGWLEAGAAPASALPEFLPEPNGFRAALAAAYLPFDRAFVFVLCNDLAGIKAR